MELKMFMWEWQHIFQSAVELLLEKVFRLLEIEVEHRVIVLGVPIESENANQIYFHPEVCGYNQYDFSSVFRLAKENYENDPGQNLIMTAAHLYKAHRESLYPKALKKSIESILSEHDSATDFVSFCSFPIKLDDHWITVLIQVDAAFYYSQSLLPEETYGVSSARQYDLDCSFLETVIHTVLSRSRRQLELPSRGQYLFFGDSERCLEDAASGFMNSVRLRVNEMGGELLELANAISSERYEGGGSKGRLLIAASDNPALQVQINLSKPVSIHDYRAVRKLLEISSHDMALICDGRNIWGLGSLDYSKIVADGKTFEIKFTEHYTWELYHLDDVLFRVKYRQARLPRKRFDEIVVRDHLERIFQVSGSQADLLIDAVQAAVEQRHGTMLVISAEAANEAERLKAQSTLIEPTSCSHFTIKHLSSVDGAIILSPDGIIYAFGAILDGLATGNGTSSRGARFNSAIRYADQQNTQTIQCLTLIVSEDGYVDLYPTLRKRIARKTIDDLMNELESIIGDNQHYDAERAWSLLISLSDLSFYLLDKDISRANSISEIVTERETEHRQKDASRSGLGFIFPSKHIFSVHEDMSIEYYLPE